MNIKLTLLLATLTISSINAETIREQLKKLHASQQKYYFALQMEYPVYNTQANVNPIYNGKMAAQHIRFNNPLDGGYLGTTACSQYLNISVPILSFMPFIGAIDEPINRRIDGTEYLNILVTRLTQALYELNKDDNFPDLIIFNAGSDIFERDDLGMYQKQILLGAINMCGRPRVKMT